MSRTRFPNLHKQLAELPKYTDSDASYVERVRMARDRIVTDSDKMTPASLARHYRELRDTKDIMTAELSSLEVELEAVAQLMTQHFEEEGLTQVKTDRELISVYAEPYSSVEDPEALRQWCVSEGLERRMTLPWVTVNSITKQRLEDGLPAPDGVRIYAKDRIRMERLTK
jgi:multidrug efflux pump subunit AcrB